MDDIAVHAAVHISVIDGLRALACAAVCLYHTTGFSLFQSSAYTGAAGYGWLGYDVFFVISGFVIPYALHWGGYRISGFGRFLARRLVRLEPPYLATVALTASAMWLAGQTRWHRGGPIQLSWRTILLHVGYLNGMAGRPWLLDSFWTLAVEFQFYLLLGLLFPLLAARRRWASPALLALAGGAAWAMPDPHQLPHYLPVFLCGVFAFRYRCLKASALHRGWELGLAGGGALVLTASLIGGAVAMVAGATAAAILWVRYTHPWLRWLGGISYSLYLIHGLIIPVVVVQGARLFGTGPAAEAGLTVLALAASLVAALALHRGVESPARRWARRIRYQAVAQSARPAQA